MKKGIFVACCVSAVLAILLYLAATSSRPTGQPAGTPAPDPVEFISSVPSGPIVLFRNASPGDLNGRIAVARLPITKGPRLIAPISCERVHYAAGWGVCMVTDEERLPARFFADVFDRSFERRHRVPLTGPPIRARVSPDGRRAAMTVFETGHSYADAIFSTRTIVIDTAAGRTIADLEDFSVLRDGRPFKSPDFNFWGVTFAENGDRFFATLMSGGVRYLVKGSIDAREATVVRTDVECPSLSPDGTLVAFKKPLGREIGWRLHILDLNTGTEHALNQVRRSVDDQVDWFDAGHVVYYDSSPDGAGAWVLSIDGVTPASLLIANAYSPAIQR